MSIVTVNLVSINLTVSSMFGGLTNASEFRTNELYIGPPNPNPHPNLNANPSVR